MSMGFGGGLLAVNSEVDIEHSTIGHNNEDGIRVTEGALRGDHLTVAENTLIGVSGPAEIRASILVENGTSCSSDVMSVSNFFNSVVQSPCYTTGDVFDTTNALLPFEDSSWPLGTGYFPLNPAQPLTHDVSVDNCTIDQLGFARGTPCDPGAVERLIALE